MGLCTTQARAWFTMLHMHQVCPYMSPQLVQQAVLAVQAVVKDGGCAHHSSSPRSTDCAELVQRKPSPYNRDAGGLRNTAWAPHAVRTFFHSLLLGEHLRAAQRDDGQQDAAAAGEDLAQARQEALLALHTRLVLRHAVRGLHDHCTPRFHEGSGPGRAAVPPSTVL